MLLEKGSTMTVSVFLRLFFDNAVLALELLTRLKSWGDLPPADIYRFRLKGRNEGLGVGDSPIVAIETLDSGESAEGHEGSPFCGGGILREGLRGVDVKGDEIMVVNDWAGASRWDLKVARRTLVGQDLGTCIQQYDEACQQDWQRATSTFLGVHPKRDKARRAPPEPPKRHADRDSSVTEASVVLPIRSTQRYSCSWVALSVGRGWGETSGDGGRGGGWTWKVGTRKGETCKATPNGTAVFGGEWRKQRQRVKMREEKDVAGCW
ncbi:hypothetical protein BDM02DRAFT_3233225 [Thelephora ganbajun]|uniref:Uncharacterized protein n=1 Tax=Thelephora ganbajun TaxID=370292 RepID=A0ACB6YZT0_THEGA|nr:hypothetical protein BDM02DRAFT_3233225 [Thelephora ganbajun]